MQLGWIDFSKEDRQKAFDVINLLSEQGAVDELGIGVIRDAFANYFFPGTSTMEWVLDKSVFDFSFFGKSVLCISLFNCVGFSNVGFSNVGFSCIGLSNVGFSNVGKSGVGGCGCSNIT